MNPSLYLITSVRRPSHERQATIIKGDKADDNVYANNSEVELYEEGWITWKGLGDYTYECNQWQA